MHKYRKYLALLLGIALMLSGCQHTQQSTSASMSQSPEQASNVAMQDASLSKVKQVAAADDASYILFEDGALWGWNYNTALDAYVGDHLSRVEPKLVLSDVERVFMEDSYGFALKTDGELWAWRSLPSGRMPKSQQGNYIPPEPVLVTGDVVHVGSGSLVTKTDGTLWSLNEKPSVPGGSYIEDYNILDFEIGMETKSENIAKSVLDRRQEARSALRYELRDDASLWYVAEGLLAPHKIMENVEDIIKANTKASTAVCILTKDGGLWVWGQFAPNIATAFNLDSEPRSLTTFFDDVVIPEPIHIADEVTSVAWGQNTQLYTTVGHLYILKQDGTLWGVGDNRFGQLLDPALGHSKSLQQIASDIAQIACGSKHAIALKSDGTVITWGDNEAGQLANNEINYQAEPLRVLDEVIQMSAAPYTVSWVRVPQAHSLAVKEDGTLWGWGDNFFGQLDDSGDIRITTPRQLRSGVRKAVAAPGFTLFLDEESNVWEYGRSANTKYIDDEDLHREPVVGMAPVKILGNVVDISASSTVCLALTTNGELWHWRNSFFNGNDFETNMEPQLLADKVKDYFLGEAFLLVIADDDSLWRYDLPVYRIGEEEPEKLLDNVTYAAASSGAIGFNGIHLYHGLVLSADGTVWGWGSDAQGQLTPFSDEDTAKFIYPEGATTPMRGSYTIFLPLTQLPIQAKAVYAGCRTSLFLGDDGKLTIQGRGYPKPLTILDDVASVAVGGEYYLALKEDGSLWAWGDNATGQLGNGRSEAYTTPQVVDLGSLKR